MDLSMMDFDGSDLRGLKIGKTEDFSSVSFSCKNMLRSNSSPIDAQTMLSFSLSDSTISGFGLYNHTSNEYYTNSGKGCVGGMNGFTPSQWMELEHQALIYKHILSNVPVPSKLLFPIKKALDSAGFSIGPLKPTTYGWGGFHLGFSNNTDPEPGRCRRTDGKKWRCSRDAFPDQKYCERHINRGRHRSRKPVEVHNNGNSVSVPIATSAKPVACVGLGGGGASDLGGPNLSDSSIKMIGNCLSNDATSERNEATRDLSMFSSEINLKNNEFFTRKQQNLYTEPKQSQFGLVFSDSLVNPIHKTSSETLNERGNTFQSLVHQRPKNQFPISKDLHINAQNNRQANWMPISWESSMGGPLGEALHNTNQNISNECNNNIGLASSPNGPFHRMAFGSQHSSAGSSPRGVALSLTQLM